MTITCDPVADATRWADSQEAAADLDDAMLTEAKQQAPLIVLAQLQSLKQPGDWFRPTLSAGGLKSPDELLCEALNKDDATKSLIAALMTGPAALEVHKAMAEFAGREYAMAIYTEQVEARH